MTQFYRHYKGGLYQKLHGGLTMMIATCPHCGAGRVPGDTCYACKRFYAQSAADVESAVLRAAQRTPALSCVVIDPFMAMVKPAWRAPTVDWYPELDGRKPVDVKGRGITEVYIDEANLIPVAAPGASCSCGSEAVGRHKPSCSRNLMMKAVMPAECTCGGRPTLQHFVTCPQAVQVDTDKALDNWATMYGVPARLREPDDSFRGRILATLTGRTPPVERKNVGRGHFFSLFRRDYTGGLAVALGWTEWREVMIEPLIQGEEIPIRFNKGSRELILRSSVGAVDHLIHGSAGDEVRATYGDVHRIQVKALWRCLGGARWFQMSEEHTVKGPTAGEVTRKAATEYVSAKVAALQEVPLARDVYGRVRVENVSPAVRLMGSLKC